jgi:hypothetical protein
MTDPTVSQGPEDDQEPVHISQAVREMLATYDCAVTEYRSGDFKASILVELGYARGLSMGEYLTVRRAEQEAERFIQELVEDGFTVPDLPPLDDGPVTSDEMGDPA